MTANILVKDIKKGDQVLIGDKWWTIKSIDFGKINSEFASFRLVEKPDGLWAYHMKDCLKVRRTMKVHYYGPNVYATKGPFAYGCLELMASAEKGQGFTASSMLRDITCNECRRGIVRAHTEWRKHNGKA